jgi:hypothetical protein
METVSQIRQRIHEKAQKYFSFSYLSAADRNKFFGATDALFEVATIAEDFRLAIDKAPSAALLVCYGFLQALYVEQEAVWDLAKIFKTGWKPSQAAELEKIRDLRHRISGHPNYTPDKKRGNSSAIINRRDVKPEYFEAHVYFDERFSVVRIDVGDFRETNAKNLLQPLMDIEAKMDAYEKAARERLAEACFAADFGAGFPYLRERLWCDLGDDGRRPQAYSHAGRIKEILAALQAKLCANGFDRHANSTTFDNVLYGLDLIKNVTDDAGGATQDQRHFGLIYAGIEKHLTELIREMKSLDEQIATPI